MPLVVRMSSSSSEDELSHFKPSGLLYSNLNANSSDINSKGGPSSVLLKYYECEDSCEPSNPFSLFIFKESVVVEKLELSSRSYYHLGRDVKLNHLPLLHESVSSQHAVLQYRLRNDRCRLYLMDLDSANGTFLNGDEIEGKRFYEILDGDVVKFASSTREYVFMKKV
jgi:smad nuclear-interacting protein 1